MIIRYVQSSVLAVLFGSLLSVWQNPGAKTTAITLHAAKFSKPTLWCSGSGPYLYGMKFIGNFGDWSFNLSTFKLLGFSLLSTVSKTRGFHYHALSQPLDLSSGENRGKKKAASGDSALSRKTDLEWVIALLKPPHACNLCNLCIF